MTEIGFVKAQSDNLPKIDAFMMHSYFSSNPDFTSAEVKGVKAARSERESYGDSAIGFVQVKRDKEMCVVKARITPEHNVRLRCYAVEAICNEAEGTVTSVRCEDCPAHLGGCKHAIAFLAWLHRRSEEPSLTSTECYWKKSRMSTIGTSIKFVKARDICRARKQKPKKSNAPSFLDLVRSDCKAVGDTDNHLMRFYSEPKNSLHLSLHHLMISSESASSSDFIEDCRRLMTADACKVAELNTLQQADCPLWHELRYGRITASKAYEAAHCSVIDGCLTESILGASKLRDTKAMKRGRFLEIQVLGEVMRIRDITINKCGLRLSAAYPIMGASPDGESSEYIIEIKCPTSEKAMRRYITSLYNVAAKYMAQVQIQMHFSNKEKGLFCVAHWDFEKNKKVTIIEVNYDKQLCESLLEKCSLFWKKAIFHKLKM